MAEVRTLTTLVAKREEIERAIANYEARLEQARADLAHVNAVTTIFEASGDRDSTTVYTDIRRLFQRGELVTICKAALAEHGPMNTRALVTHILAAKVLDTKDRVLAKSVAERLIHALRMQAKRGKIGIAGKDRWVIVWTIDIGQPTYSRP
jgi:predicted transcriptional regulator